MAGQDISEKQLLDYNDVFADFFVQKRKYKDYVPSTETIDHVMDFFGLDETKACEIVANNWE